MTIASVVCSLGVLLALAGQAPTEPPAVLRRPQLQVLTKVPESQLFPMMNAIADSLGVRCDYCHVRLAPDPSKTWSLAGGWIWDRDDKRPKRIARDMMRMVADVNARQFGGRAIVSCYTCHRGSVAPATLAPLPPRAYTDAPEPATKPLPAADEVWSAYLRATGAPRFATLVMSGTDDRSEGRHGTFDVTFKGSDRARATLRMPPDGPVNQALNGDSGWLANDAGSRAARPDELERLRRAMLRYAVVKLDRPANMQIEKMERIGDRDAYVAVFDTDPRTKRMLFFDALSGLLLRERSTTETSFIPLQDQVDYEDYRNVDGVMLPFRIRSSDGSPFDTSVKVFTSIRHDVAVDDAMFQPPPAR